MNEWGFCTHKIEESTYHEISIKLKGNCCDHAVTSALPTCRYVISKMGPPIIVLYQEGANQTKLRSQRLLALIHKTSTPQIGICLPDF